jgi:hypothetical protein
MLDVLCPRLPGAFIPSGLAPDSNSNTAIHVDRIKVASDDGGLPADHRLDTFKATIASLPLQWERPLAWAKKELQKCLPTAVGEKLVLDPPLRRAYARVAAYPCGGKLYVNTEGLNASVLWTLGHLSSLLMKPSPHRLASTRALSTWIEEDPRGFLLIRKTILRVLSRGWIDGTRIMLGRHAPELYGEKRCRPLTRYPWVLLRLAPGGAPTGRIGWSQQSGTE